MTKLTTPKPRGGVREGAGRKAEAGRAAFAMVGANLDPETIAIARLIGHGNLSRGLREAVAIAARQLGLRQIKGPTP